MKQKPKNSDAVKRQQMQSKAALYASDPRKFEAVVKIVQGKLANHFRNRARAIGIKGDSYTDWVEDITSEGICLSMIELAKWDPERGPFWNWVFLHARSFGIRWMERFENDQAVLKKLAVTILEPYGISYLRETSINWNNSIENQMTIEQLIRVELSETQQRMLKLHVEGLSVKEIAHLEQYTPGTVQRYINRAQKKARKVAHLYEFEGLGVYQKPKSRDPSTPFPQQEITADPIRRPKT